MKLNPWNWTPELSGWRLLLASCNHCWLLEMLITLWLINRSGVSQILQVIKRQETRALVKRLITCCSYAHTLFRPEEQGTRFPERRFGAKRWVPERKKWSQKAEGGQRRRWRCWPGKGSGKFRKILKMMDINVVHQWWTSMPGDARGLCLTWATAGNITAGTNMTFCPMPLVVIPSAGKGKLRERKTGGEGVS